MKQDSMQIETPGRFVPPLPFSWFGQAIEKLDALGHLEAGWDSYGGQPLSPTTRNAAFAALQTIQHRELPAPTIALASDGGVAVEWQLNGRELEFHFDQNGVVESCKIDEHGEVTEASVSEVGAELDASINWLCRG